MGRFRAGFIEGLDMMLASIDVTDFRLRCVIMTVLFRRFFCKQLGL